MKSDDYRKGYQAGFQQGKRSPKRLYDLTALVRWEHIDGDEETFHCPRCGENFYSENKQAPNFCWNCGAQSLDMIKSPSQECMKRGEQVRKWIMQGMKEADEWIKENGTNPYADILREKEGDKNG